MRRSTLIFAAVIAFLPLMFCNIAAQTTRVEPNPVKATPAYAELLLRRTELTSSVESLLLDYTEEYPKVKEIKVELGFLKIEIDRLLAVKPGDTGKLSIALGKLMLRKVELETELDALRAQYKDEHPDVKKARRKVEVFESAIREILG